MKGKDEKENQKIKMIKIESSEDDSTTVFHPQRFLMRPPVVNPKTYWHLYPTSWPETYYLLYLADVGLENVLGSKQIKLLHDCQKPIKVHNFSVLNANVGRSGIKTTNQRTCEDGTTDIIKKDEWAKVVNVSELTWALDNLVAVWTVFWLGDRSMVMLRRVVSQTPRPGLN